MGQVYLARQTDGLNREVAIKTILDQHDGDYFRRKFLEEGQRQAELHHPHILPIFVAGETEDLLFLAMHFARDGNLRDRLNEGQLSIEQSVSIVSDVLKALNHAHNDLDAPLAHLDVKPENILFDGDNVCLADFGIARKVDKTTGPATMVAGDPRYWAPEQRVNNASTQSDIFALGTMFFELVTGKRPPHELSAISSKSGAKALQRLIPPEAQKYASLIARCLQEDPRYRPSANEMLEELAQIQTVKKSNYQPLLGFALILGAVYLAIQPTIQALVLQQWDVLFPPNQYPVSFAISPVKSELWIDGEERTFRELTLTEGNHNVVIVAGGYIGESHAVQVPEENLPISFELEPMPLITDESYMAFATSYGVEGSETTTQWNEPTLRNVVQLDKLEAESPVDFEYMVEELAQLADASDVVASTSLFYAAFEGVKMPGGVESYIAGLNKASDSGYSLASLLRALYILQNLLEAEQTFDNNPQAYAQMEEFLNRAATQGLPEAATKVAGAAGIQLTLNATETK